MIMNTEINRDHMQMHIINLYENKAKWWVPLSCISQCIRDGKTLTHRVFCCRCLALCVFSCALSCCLSVCSFLSNMGMCRVWCLHACAHGQECSMSLWTLCCTHHTCMCTLLWYLLCCSSSVQQCTYSSSEPACSPYSSWC